MNKRKVTDLLPSEAILISSDAERDEIMKLFDKEMGVFIKKHYLPKYPFYLRLKRNPIILWTHERLWLNTLVIPATDLIQTESDEVEVDKFETTEFKLGVFIRSKVDWYESNHDYQVATDTIRCWLDEFLQREETRNTPNQ